MPDPIKSTAGARGKREANGGPCGFEDIPPFCLVVFGASGDLTRRKILPAIYRLWSMDRLPRSFAVIGCSRAEIPEETFRADCVEAIKEALGAGFEPSAWEDLKGHFHYQRVEYSSSESLWPLSARLKELDLKYGFGGRRIFYLAVPPNVYEPLVTSLGEAGLSMEEEGFNRLVIEKPFGRDLDSSRTLNTAIRRYFKERQVFRMDHYLAKETVQNILMFRFANSIFEPLWNRRYIDHVQITVAESMGVGHRAGYYDSSGVIRDMFQNHLFQLLALTAMEPPSRFEADRIRDEKAKVFRSVRPFNIGHLSETLVTGQYAEGLVEGKPAIAYRDESEVAEGSNAPTYCAMRVHVDNWRWNGVPFYLRSGKRMKRRTAEIAICFREVPHLMFGNELKGRIEPNVLALRLQPEEGIELVFQTKQPGSRVCLSPVEMDFTYGGGMAGMEAYERVLIDCMIGDHTLFVREDGVDLAWELLTPVIAALEAASHEFPNYAAGSSGPEDALALMVRDGRRWRPL